MNIRVPTDQSTAQKIKGQMLIENGEKKVKIAGGRCACSGCCTICGSRTPAASLLNRGHLTTTAACAGGSVTPVEWRSAWQGHARGRAREREREADPPRVSSRSAPQRYESVTGKGWLCAWNVASHSGVLRALLHRGRGAAGPVRLGRRDGSGV